MHKFAGKISRVIFRIFLYGLVSYLLLGCVLYFHLVLEERIIPEINYWELKVIQRLISKREAENKMAKPEIIYRTNVSPAVKSKTLKEVLNYFKKNINDTELIFYGEFGFSIVGVRFKNADLTYYCYFEKSVNKREAVKFLTYKQFVYLLFNSRVVALETVSSDGKAELCGQFCEFLNECHLAFFSLISSDKYLPFGFYGLKSDITQKEYLVKVSELSQEEREELGMKGLNLLWKKFLYLVFIGNPWKIQQVYIISNAGYPEFVPFVQIHVSDFERRIKTSYH